MRAGLRLPASSAEMRGESEAYQKRLLQEELKELFGPAFGPVVEAYGRSFAERLCEDGELLAEVREHYEQGRAEGRFPVLSEVLAGRSGEEIEDFFRSGWVSIVLPPPEPASKPWDHAPWNGNIEAYREDLYAGLAFGLPDLRSFAQQWIEELARVGYYGMEESLGLPLKQQADDLSAVPRPLPLYGEAYPLRLGDAERAYWLQLDAGRSERGYRSVTLSDEPLRTDKAILAALTSLEGRTLSMEKLRRVLPEVMSSHGEFVWDRWTGTLGRRGVGEGLVEDLESLRHHRSLDYVLALLRYHRPGFDDLPREERIALTEGVCEHINGFLEALRKLMAFVEHGVPGRRIPPATTKVVNRGITAAVLRDVDGLTYREIGRKLGVPPPENKTFKGDYPTVRKMVRRGRKVLERALGEEGWQRQAEAMRAEAERWLSMSEVEREAEVEAEAFGVTFEEAMRRLEAERARRGGKLGDEPGIV